MSLIIYSIFIFLYNSYFVQSIDIPPCRDKQYYNSLIYKCETCDNIHLNICYHENISVYTFDKLKKAPNCSNSEIFTELDGNRNLLQEPQCVNDTFDYSDVDLQYKKGSPNGNIETTLGTGGIFYFDNNRSIYYKHSCINGSYERACDYSANLCALSLYNYNNNPFCDIIKLLDSKLHNYRIL